MIARRKGPRSIRLAIVVLVAFAAQQAMAQQPPFLSPLDAAHHAAKMAVCIELWNLYVAEEQTNEDPGTNIDLSEHLIHTHIEPQERGSKSITIDTEPSQLAGVCGALIVAGPGVEPVTMGDTVMATSSVDITKAPDQYFDITSLGGQVGEETLSLLQKVTDNYSTNFMQMLTSLLGASGAKLSDLRIIAHQPALPIDSSNKFTAYDARHTAAALRILYPGQ